MIDVARLGIVVDSSPVKGAVADLDRLGQQAVKAERSVSNAGRGMSTSFASNMGSIRKAALATAGGLSALLVIRGAANMADTWSDLSARIGLAVGDMSKAQEVMKRLGSMADRSYTSLQITAEGWLQNATALRELGMSTEDTLDFVEALNNAMVVSGAKGNRAELVMNALSRSMAVGKLAGEDLNMILKYGGRFAELLAEDLGTTTSGLKALGAEGKLTGSVIDKALRGNLEKLREEADAMPATVADGFLRIRNAMLQLVGGADQVGGVSAGVAQALVNLSDGIKAMIPVINGLAGGFNMLANIVSAMANGISTVVQPVISALGLNLNSLLAVAGAVAVFFATRFTASLAISLVGGMRAAMTEAIRLEMALGAMSARAAFGSIALRGLSSALTVLRGALIATGIGALIVLAGVLIGKFLDLVEATGGFGSALAQLGELAVAVWQGIIGSAGIIPPGLSEIWNLIRAEFYTLIADLQRAWYQFLTFMGNSFSSFGMDGPASFVGEAAEHAGKGLDATLEKVTAASKKAADAFGAQGVILAEAWAPAKAKIDQMRASIDKAKSSSRKLTDSINDNWGGGGGGKDTKPKAAGEGGKSEAEKAADKATEALEKLRQKHVDLQATMGMSEAQQRIYAAVQELGVGATDAQRQEVERLIPAIDRLQAAQDRIREVADTLKEGFGTLFRDAVTGAKSLGDALGDLAGKLADMFANQAFNALWGQFGGAITGAVTQSVPSFAGGGYTGRGSRTGGVDGLGGFPAILHRNETVVDHTRKQSAGGMSYSPTFNIGGQVTAEDLAAVRQEAANGFAQMKKAFPQQLQRSMVRTRERY